MPVVDRHGHFVGVIPPDRLVAVLLSEHDEDLSRFGGFPWLFDAFALDPAFGSSPLATVVQDLLSIWIYLSVTTLVMS